MSYSMLFNHDFLISLGFDRQEVDENRYHIIKDLVSFNGHEVKDGKVSPFVFSQFVDLIITNTNNSNIALLVVTEKTGNSPYRVESVLSLYPESNDELVVLLKMLKITERS